MVILVLQLWFSVLRVRVFRIYTKVSDQPIVSLYIFEEYRFFRYVHITTPSYITSESGRYLLNIFLIFTGQKT
jgi:hypothetical protein